MYEIIGIRQGITTVLATAKSKGDALNLWREYHHAFASDTTLAGKYDSARDWRVNLRQKEQSNDQ